jgi:hypothetical protein
MEHQKHSSCECGGQNVTESRAIAKEVGKVLKENEMLEENRRKIKDKLVRILGTNSDKVDALEKRLAPLGRSIGAESLEDDINKVVDKETVIELINDMVPAQTDIKDE